MERGKRGGGGQVPELAAYRVQKFTAAGRLETFSSCFFTLLCRVILAPVPSALECLLLQTPHYGLLEFACESFRTIGWASFFWQMLEFHCCLSAVFYSRLLQKEKRGNEILNNYIVIRHSLSRQEAAMFFFMSNDCSATSRMAQEAKPEIFVKRYSLLNNVRWCFSEVIILLCYLFTF